MVGFAEGLLVRSGPRRPIDGPCADAGVLACAQVKALTSALDTERRRYLELEERKGHLEEQLQEVEDWKQT